MVLAGLAGAGKTALLHRLAGRGAAIVDLEGLAGHRGSAFGGLGRPPQPAQPEFHAAVLGALDATDHGPVWVEDEGAFVGARTVPARLRAQIETADVVEVRVSFERRLARLVAEYGDLDPALLIGATQRIRRRLGNSVADRAISHVANRRPEAAIAAVLPYFDDAYRHRWRCLARRVVARVEP